MTKQILSLNDTLTFGKYKGLAVREIIERDPDYLAWACDTIEWFNIDQDAIDALDWVLMSDDDRLFLDALFNDGYDGEVAF